MKFKEHIENTMNTLKDFQKATVIHVMEKMNAGQQKFLIADEVGLGKTIVAKGILAKMYEQEYSATKEFKVIYICSNQALAKQNIEKLNFIKEDDPYSSSIIDYNAQDDRLTSLAYKPNKKKSKYGLSIRALTPGTSFDTKRGRGRSDERVLLYRLLLSHKALKSRKTALKWFLKGGKQKGEKSWNDEINWADEFDKGNTNIWWVRPIYKKLYSRFRGRLTQPLSKKSQKNIYGDFNDKRRIIDAIKIILQERKQERSFQNGKDFIAFEHYYGLIGELRLQLSIVCKDYLKADIFILDEFQRFSKLINQEEAENEGEKIAKAIFSDEKAKVILLSATPFKPYTTSFEEYNGEHHYKEFKSVLKFLYPSQTNIFWDELDLENRKFHKGIKTFGLKDTNKDDLLKVKNSIEVKYTQCISRTERVLVEDVNVSKKNNVKLLELNIDDVEDYIALDKIIIASNELNKGKLAQPIEYVKSAPFPLSFLQDYEHYKKLKRNYAESPDLQKLIRKSKNAFVPIDRINNYKPLLPERSINEPNPKLRLLYDETVRNNGYKLLWIPPSIKYYQPRSGAFHNTDNFSKTLIFSAWKMVPRMVSALVSYEAERLSIGKLIEQENLKERHVYKNTRSYPYPLLTFRTTDEGLTGMNNILLSYPSIYLSSLYNPANNLVEKKKLSIVRKEIQQQIFDDLINVGALKIGTVGGNIQKWDWFSVLLLDRNHPLSKDVQTWINNGEVNNVFDNENETDNKKNDTHKSAKSLHFKEIKRILNGGEVDGIGKIDETKLLSIAEYLTELCLGSPGVCSLRAIESIYASSSFESKLSASLNMGIGFITMFNKPESIAVVKVSGKENFYYQNVVSYSIDGNIQAMLDEFIFQISDSGGISNCIKASEMVKDILSVGRSKVDVMVPKSIQDNKHFPMRTHYAVPFGTASSSNLKNGKREIKVREAFNSPFRPFVLTSTSIGQEGLDFHYYCKKMIHWNLPNNPIDLEQREGRIKRYKSHLIRMNVADLGKEAITEISTTENVWNVLFKFAESEKEKNEFPCDLIPFWYLNSENNSIDSIIPIYPFSKDVSKLEHIKTVLMNYRLTFGHPNQQDLINSISKLPDDMQDELKSMLINLCPLKTNNDKSY
ncbi:MAG: DEAD/DEAH box helicase [Chitinophagales bacterium]